MLGNVGNSSHIPEADKSLPAHSMLSQSGLQLIMNLQHWWLILAVECISSQSLPQKRKCAFRMTSQNKIYKMAGNVSGSVQVCENTHCCVGFYKIVNDQPEVDVLACDIAENSCSNAICMGETQFIGPFLKCVCNTDLCNSNITWTPESEQPRPTYFYSGGEIWKTVSAILTGTFLLFLFVIIAHKLRSLFTKQKKLQVCRDDYSVSPPCFFQTTDLSEIDTANIELQQILANGHFATVWQGKYQGSVVAVKVFPACWKHKFTTEKEIFELPLMKHDGIVHFLGTGRNLDSSSWLIVLQFVEHGSLHSFLNKHITSWMLSLKLCQSLSQGLSYLHSDLHQYGAHKPPVAHRNLSSFSVLVRADGTCVLSDFGCSTILHSCSGSHTTIMEDPSQMGMLQYMSPEILEGSVNLKNSFCFMQGDIYSLALLLWEIWMHCSDLCEGGVVPQHLLPYEYELGANVTLESLIQFVFHMEMRPSLPVHWKLLPQGSELQELLEDCWDCDPEARLTAQCVVDRLASLCSLFP
nr:anti-Muellerian hormone type-2 receptor isoform X2 [Monopterus albus]